MLAQKTPINAMFGSITFPQKAQYVKGLLPGGFREATDHEGSNFSSELIHELNDNLMILLGGEGNRK